MVGPRLCVEKHATGRTEFPLSLHSMCIKMFSSPNLAGESFPTRCTNHLQYSDCNLLDPGPGAFKKKTMPQLVVNKEENQPSGSRGT